METNITVALISGICMILAAALSGVLGTVLGEIRGRKKGKAEAFIEDLSILDVLDIPVWVLDSKFQVTWLNQSAMDINALTLEEAKRWSAEDLIRETHKHFVDPDEGKMISHHWLGLKQLAANGFNTWMSAPPCLCTFAEGIRKYMAVYARKMTSGRLAGHYIVVDQIIPEFQALINAESPDRTDTMKPNVRVSIEIIPIESE